MKTNKAGKETAQRLHLRECMRGREKTSMRKAVSTGAQVRQGGAR